MGVLYRNYLASEAWAGKYPSREFWANLEFGGKSTHKIREVREWDKSHEMEKRMFKKIPLVHRKIEGILSSLCSDLEKESKSL